MSWALALALLAACTGHEGTLTIDLTTAPGSTVIDGVTRLRLTVTSTNATYETRRTSSGLDLALDLEATGKETELIVEGFDVSDALIASGQSPPFSISGTDTHVAIYVASPLSIAPAPVAFAAPWSNVSGDTLVYGAVFAGGRDTNDAPVDTLAIYNVYNHTIAYAMAMPVMRSGLTVAASSFGAVYLFGGISSQGTVTNTLHRFLTTVPPAGTYADLGEQASLARADQIAIRIGADRFLITGMPPVLLEAGVMSMRSEVTELLPAGAAVLPEDGVVTAIAAGGPSGLVRFRADVLDVIPGDARERGAIVGLPGGQVLVIGGGTGTTPTRDALIVDAVTGAVAPRANTLATGRFAPAVAATRRHVVVAGGVDAAGAPIATAEIFDAMTLGPVAVVPLVPRVGTFALAMPNDQVMIAGGDSPTDLIELFTPTSPLH